MKPLVEQIGSLDREMELIARMMKEAGPTQASPVRARKLRARLLARAQVGTFIQRLLRCLKAFFVASLAFGAGFGIWLALRPVMPETAPRADASPAMTVPASTPAPPSDLRPPVHADSPPPSPSASNGGRPAVVTTVPQIVVPGPPANPRRSASEAPNRDIDRDANPLPVVVPEAEGSGLGPSYDSAFVGGNPTQAVAPPATGPEFSAGAMGRTKELASNRAARAAEPPPVATPGKGGAPAAAAKSAMAGGAAGKATTGGIGNLPISPAPEGASILHVPDPNETVGCVVGQPTRDESLKSYGSISLPEFGSEYIEIVVRANDEYVELVRRGQDGRAIVLSSSFTAAQLAKVDLDGNGTPDLQILRVDGDEAQSDSLDLSYRTPDGADWRRWILTQTAAPRPIENDSNLQ